MPPKASSSKAAMPKKEMDAVKQEADAGDAQAEGSAVTSASKEKMPLQKWLGEFTSRGVNMRVAMALASKLYPTNQSQADIIKLTGPKLQAAGIVDKEQKKSVMSAVRSIKLSTGSVHGKIQQDAKDSKKRKRALDGENPLLPKDPSSSKGKERASDYDFRENHDIELIRAKTCKTNRAPCMTAWAFIILEKMGFDRIEALSLASVFTSITSTQHALNLGNIYNEAQTKDAKLELAQLPGRDAKRRRANGEQEEEESGGNAQPWVGVMRRRLPVIQLHDGTWRGLTKGMAVEPIRAYSYITRNFADATPYVIGALRMLAQCYTLDELQERGYGMYVSFRPEVQGWGDKAILYCSNIIDMIPPENEVDLALHGTIVPQPTGSKEQLIHVKEEDFDEAAIEQVKKEVENDVVEMKGEEGGFEKGKDDVFEGFFEAEYDDDF